MAGKTKEQIQQILYNKIEITILKWMSKTWIHNKFKKVHE